MNIRHQSFTVALILAMLSPTFAARASCTNDAPEVGDIGPASELVCAELEQRYSASELSVEGRSIHSPNAVSLHVLVNGTPRSMRYELIGYQWHLDAGGGTTGGNRDGVVMHQ